MPDSSLKPRKRPRPEPTIWPKRRTVRIPDPVWERVVASVERGSFPDKTKAVIYALMHCKKLDIPAGGDLTAS